MSSTLAPLFDRQTISALGFVGSMVAAAVALASVALPKAPRQQQPSTPSGKKSKKSSSSSSAFTSSDYEDSVVLAGPKVKAIYTWLVFDSICHLTLEGSFLYLSTFGRTVNDSKGFFAYLWQDYAKADARWGWADETVVALEILTVLGAGPLAGYCAYLLSKNKFSYHYWVVVLSTAELYGGFMTFAPEWLTGNKYLSSNNWLLLWVYLFFMNMIWVVIPVYLLYDSFRAITNSTNAGAVSYMTTSPTGSPATKTTSVIQEVKTAKVVEKQGASSSAPINLEGAIRNAEAPEENVFLFVPNLIGGWRKAATLYPPPFD